MKPKLAQEQGAVGCIIYSDPADDGYGENDVYPKGGARPDFSVQRGSVADMTVYPGDPLTPGVGAVPGAKRLTREAAATVLKIPTLPMSYGDARQILALLGGPLAPADFRGGLPLAYHVGGDGKTQLHLAVKSDWSLKPLYDVIAMLPGKDRPDEWVIRGNHHDGWVFGAAGSAFGQCRHVVRSQGAGGAGQEPAGGRRGTIVYASWDAEEPMLLRIDRMGRGSTPPNCRRKAVIYINTDGNGRGFLECRGQP